MRKKSDSRAAPHCTSQVEVPVEHGLLMENLLDLAHAPFTHTSTFARGWPIPDLVSVVRGLTSTFWCQLTRC